MHPKDLSINDYTYTLPPERIAAYPLPQRDASRLLVYKNGNISLGSYHDIANHLPADSLLIFNNTKVVEARLLFQKTTGSIIELFCLEPHEKYPDISTALQQHDKVLWKCLVGGASKWKHGQVLEKKVKIGDVVTTLAAVYVEKRPEHFIIEFSWAPGTFSFAEILHHAGAIPLPPYIKRPAEASDSERYQTIYADADGSVAAPTAGLHFTEHIFEQLQQKNIRKDFVTLHVGAGTFKPVKTETMSMHHMHGEQIEVTASTIQSILQHLDNNIVAVGTTSMRTIESLYWIGVKMLLGASSTATGNKSEHFILDQWEPYELNDTGITVKSTLREILRYLEKNNEKVLHATTRLIIAPGYTPRIAKALITNFHQPQSTLLLLVAALVGNDWRKMYEYALANDFRFLSYGDGCLLWFNTELNEIDKR